jgi:hypothetical protein|tara:strand:+ start:41 stop:472 length:432 start_codon:yes stop_codon:yes gene_type:complete
MTLEELQHEARNDLAVIDQERLDQESLKNQTIKSKWLEHRTRYDQLLIMRRADHQKMYRQKWEYYGGKADAKVYAAKPFDIKVLKNDLTMYIQSDDDILEIQGKISYYESIVKYVDGVIKSIDNRGWDIKNAIEWKKFEAGMM